MASCGASGGGEDCEAIAACYPELAPDPAHVNTDGSVSLTLRLPRAHSVTLSFPPLYPATAVTLTANARVEPSMLSALRERAAAAAADGELVGLALAELALELVASSSRCPCCLEPLLTSASPAASVVEPPCGHAACAACLAQYLWAAVEATRSSDEAVAAATAAAQAQAAAAAAARDATDAAAAADAAVAVAERAVQQLRAQLADASAAAAAAAAAPPQRRAPPLSSRARKREECSSDGAAEAAPATPAELQALLGAALESLAVKQRDAAAKRERAARKGASGVAAGSGAGAGVGVGAGGGAVGAGGGSVVAAGGDADAHLLAAEAAAAASPPALVCCVCRGALSWQWVAPWYVRWLRSRPSTDCSPTVPLAADSTMSTSADAATADYVRRFAQRWRAGWERQRERGGLIATARE